MVLGRLLFGYVARGFAQQSLQRTFGAPVRGNSSDVSESNISKSERNRSPTVQAQELYPITSFPLAVPSQGVEFEYPARPTHDESRFSPPLQYDESLTRVRNAGYKRHPSSQELYGLLFDSLEGKLTANEKLITEDMQSCCGEWLNVAFERQGDELIAYVNPEGLEWKGDYEHLQTKDFRYTERKEFDIGRKPSHEWLDLNLFSDDFVQFVCGRPYAQLPLKMRSGEKKTKVFLLKEGITAPVGLHRFSIDACYYQRRVSRGVR